MGDVAPLLQADVEDAADLAGQQAAVTRLERAQRGQDARDRIEGGFVDGDDRGSEGSKSGVSIVVQASLEQGGELSEELLKRSSAGSIQAFVDSLIADRDAGVGPEAAGSKQAPDGASRGGMAQSTEEEGSPEEESREDTRSARRAGGRVIDGRSEGRDEGAEEAFDIREQGLRGGSGQSGEEGGGLVKVNVWYHGSSMPQVEFLRQPSRIPISWN